MLPQEQQEDCFYHIRAAKTFYERTKTEMENLTN